MTQRVRHIWARAGQHIKVHRKRPRRQRNAEHENDDDKDEVKIILAILGVIVFVWILM